jgi:hypothetical protein
MTGRSSPDEGIFFVVIAAALDVVEEEDCACTGLLDSPAAVAAKRKRASRLLLVR